MRILTENINKLNEDDDENNYVIHNEEKYYLNDSYIRNELMDEVCNYAIEQLSDTSWINDVINDNYQAYRDNQKDINVDEVFEYIKDNYPEYEKICDSYYNYEYDIEDEIKTLLKDNAGFSAHDYVGDYVYDSEDETFEGAEIDIKDLFNFTLLKENKIKVYDDDKEEYLEEQLITEAEAQYILGKLNKWVYGVYSDDFYEYINKKKNEPIYYNINYTVYRKIDIDRFMEELKEEYSNILFYKSEDNSVWEEEE